eukprot:1371928-Amorphochlora_amoeboformis.AAC.1
MPSPRKKEDDHMCPDSETSTPLPSCASLLRSPSFRSNASRAKFKSRLLEVICTIRNRRQTLPIGAQAAQQPHRRQWLPLLPGITWILFPVTTGFYLDSITKRIYRSTLKSLCTADDVRFKEACQNETTGTVDYLAGGRNKVVLNFLGFVIVETVDNIAESHMYYHRTAQFGKQEPYSVTGWLSVPERVDLCSNEGIRNTTYANSIVLALRGNCSFFHKAVVAEGAGAIGIVIGNDQWDARELRMIREDDEETRGLPDVTIPVATIAGIDYQNAMQKIMNGMKRNATFGAKLDQLYDVEYSTKLKFNIVPALVLILVWATIIGMYFCRKYLIRYISRQHRVSAMRVVPTVEYRAAESKEEDEEEDDTGRSASRAPYCQPR